MGLFDFFRKKERELPLSKGSYIPISLADDDLHTLINQAIDIFEASGDATPDQIILEIYHRHPDQQLAIALYRFIPIAFCRLFMTDPAYADEYFVMDKTQQATRFRYSTDHFFSMIAFISKQRILQSADPEASFAVLYHSADFRAIQHALDQGAALHEIECSPSRFNYIQLFGE